MWQHRHTATVILVLAAGTARADFTSAWQDYFATQQMAAESYSGSVERCHAVGVTPDEPSFWDYLTGKNRAKLLSVKANISATCTNFLRPYLANDHSYLDYLETGTVAGLRWTSATQFLDSIGLPTNALDETPWFRLQYTNTVGGWHTARICLSNMIVTEAAVDWTPNVWSNRNILATDGQNTHPYTFSSLPLIIHQHLLGLVNDLLEVDLPRLFTDTRSWYEFTSYYDTNMNLIIPSLPIPLPSLVRIYNPKATPPEFFAQNARGSWTTRPEPATWATNYEMARDGWLKALNVGIGEWPTNTMQAPDKYGISWNNACYPYMVKTRPRAIIAAKGANGEAWTDPVPVTNLVFTNEIVYPQTSSVSPIYEEFSFTVTTTNVTTNDLYAIITNYIPITNMVVSIVSSNATTNQIPELYISDTVTVAYAFGTAFVGTYIETNGYEYSIHGVGFETNWTFVYETNAVPTNMPVYTNVFAGVSVETNIESETYTFNGDIIGYETNVWDDLSRPQTNLVTNEVVVLTSNKTFTARIAAGAVIANGIPYVGAQKVYKQIGVPGFCGREYPMDFPYTNYAPMAALYTGVAHTVDIYYKWASPSNNPFTVPIFHGFKQSANPNYESLSAVYETFAQSESEGWCRQTHNASMSDVVFGDTVFPNLNLDDNADLSDYTLFDAMAAAFENQFGYDGPDVAEVWSLGREIVDEFSAVWWDGENGFKWK